MNILSILLSRYHGINVENVFRFQIPRVNGLDAWVPAVSDTSQMLDFDLGVEYEVRPPPFSLSFYIRLLVQSSSIVLTLRLSIRTVKFLFPGCPYFEIGLIRGQDV